MDQEHQDSREDQRFAEAVEEYYRRQREAGSVELEKFLEEFQDVRGLVEAFLVDLGEVNSLLSENETASQEIETAFQTLRDFGDYELQNEIARGGMGIVFKAKQVSLDRVVAVKMILAGQLASDDDVARFRQEAMAVANLHHPNIVSLFEVGEHQGQQFFSMEYVDGDNLAVLVNQKLFDARTAATHAQNIALTLSFIHSNGFLHRDIKPSNVLIERGSGVVRITDFGLAKRTNSLPLFTRTGQVMGTPSYMSPEQASGQNDRVGIWTDIYSTGAILYHLITGRPPFRGETDWDTSWQVIHCEAVAPSSLNPNVPRDLETICLKCLQKEPPRRYSTAKDLADDLGRFLRGEPVLARPRSRFERAWRWCRRNPTLALVSGLAGAAILGLVVSLFIVASAERSHALTLANALSVSESRERATKIRLAETERDQALRLCEQGDVDLGCLWLCRSLQTAPVDAVSLRRSIRLNLGAWQRELCQLRGIYVEQRHGLAFSPDGELFTTCDSHQCYVRRTSDLQQVGSPLSHKFQVQKSIFGSDNRTLLLKGREQASLWKREADTWIEQKLKMNPRGFCGLRLTNDLRPLFAYSTAKGIRIDNAATGEQYCALLPADSYNPGEAFISPDGRYALTQPRRGELILSNLKESRVIGNAMNHPARVEMVAFSSRSDKIATACTQSSGSSSVVHIQLWDTERSEKIGQPMTYAANSSLLKTLLYLANDERMVTASSDKKLRVWNSSGKLEFVAIHDVDRVRGSADGRFLAYISEANEARLMEVDTQKMTGQPLGQMTDTLCDLELSPTGSHILVGTAKDIRLWEIPVKSQMLARAQIDLDNVKSSWLTFSADNQTLLLSHVQNSMLVAWDVRSGKLRAKSIKTHFGLNSWVLGPDGRWAIIGSRQKLGPNPAYRSLYHWNLETGELQPRHLPQHANRTHSIALSRDGRRLVSVGDTGTIYIYNTAADRIEAGPLQHPGNPELLDSRRLSVVISPDQHFFAVYSIYEDIVTLWDMATGVRVGEPIQTFPGLTSVMFGPDSQTLVTAGQQIQLWSNLTRERQVKQYDCPSPVKAIAISPDGVQLALAHENRIVRVWDTTTQKLVGQPIQLTELAYRLTFAQDGLLVTGAINGATVWDPITGVQVGPKLSSSAYTTVSSDGRLIAGGSGRYCRIWGVSEPVSDDATAVTYQVEHVVGRRLDDEGQIRSIPREEWEKLTSK